MKIALFIRFKGQLGQKRHSARGAGRNVHFEIHIFYSQSNSAHIDPFEFFCDLLPELTNETIIQ